jgi:formylglycine-generating enzyme required for sulfatase activity
MSGNVYEWCEDWYGNYTSDALINPTGPATGSYRVYRGGSWYHDATYCRTSYRYYSSPSSSNSRTGLRLAMYDLSSFDPLAVSTGELQLTVGDKQSVSVTGGSGHYSVQSTSVVTATLSDGVVSLTAVIPGSTVVTVTDDITHEQASIRITVISAAPISTNTVTPGLYMSILGFNQQLYTKGFSLLNRSTEGAFTGFVNSLTPQDGTILYYAEDVALDSLVRAPYPQNLNNVVLVTFTDGLDQGSLMLTDKGYTSDSQYASALASRIASTKVHGLPLQAYSIGLKGTDVTDDDMFMSNLRSLASSEENVYLVNNINEVTAKFNDIANNLSMSSYTYSHTLTLTIPGISNGTRIRFTFDDVNSSTVANSQQYIEGTFNLANRSLTNVTYHGMTCSSGTTIMPKEVNGVYVTYVFDDIVLGTPSEQINKNKIQEWYWVSNYNNWQINSEFTPSSIDDVDVQTIYSSAIVMLVLDSSSSLINDFSQLKSAANQFITTLADYDSFTTGTLSQNSITLTVGSEKTVEILNGSGSFTVSGGDGIVTARIEGRQLILTGKQEGTTTLTITDVATQTTMTLQVVVYEEKEGLFCINGVFFTMVSVEGGTFTMGATAEQGSDAYSDEKPAHEVTLSSFSIGETEVTQALWQAVMGSNPSRFTGDLNRPVEQVSWNDCQTFITKLNQMTGKTFRLPTEAEWEFAARGGNLSQGYKYSGSNTIGDVAWYASNSGYTTHPVGTKAPNELGLYDMSGNVWEWCQDWYGSYSSSPSTNPTGPTSGSARVHRGGSWHNYYTRDCRVSHRGSSSLTFSYLGLRLAL